MGIALITNNILSDSGTAVAGLVPTSRTISTTAPLTGGGDLSADRTIAIPAATTSVNGYLTSADWTTFNAKQAAGNYIVSLTGEATAVGPGAAAVTLNNASVTGKVLTGVNITGGTVLATDTMLTAFGKLQNQINGLIGSTIYQGVWNATTNTPTLASGVGTRGYYYIVNVAGTTNLNGITDWQIGDWAIFDGTAWQKVDNTDAVTSVNGFTGAVSLTTDNIAEGATNLYFSNARSRSAISLTTTGSSGFATYNNTTGVLNIPQYQSVLTNPITGSLTASYIPKATGATTLGNSIIYENATGIGIGTNGPLARLHVDSSAALTAIFDCGANNTYISWQNDTSPFGDIGSAASLATGGNTNDFAIRARDTYNIIFATNATEKMRLTNGGKLGIGTTSVPTGRLLAVSGGAQFNGAALMEGANFSIIPAANGQDGVILNVGYDTGTDYGSLFINTGGNTSMTLTKNGAVTFAGSATATSIIKVGGTSSQFLKADGSVDSNTYGTGTVTSVAALTLGTTGTDLSSSVANGTTTPVITLNVPTASATNRGALSAADWTTFNNKASTASLANYLPLAGGTLTGALSGTSATFNGQLNVNYANTWFRNPDNLVYRGVVFGATIPDDTEYASIKYQPNSGQLVISASPSGFGGNTLFKNNNITWLSVNAINALSFTGAATFSSSVTANNAIFNGAGQSLQLTSASDVYLNVTRGSSFVNIGVDSTGTFYNTNSNHRWLYNSGSNEAMRITSSGNVGIGTTSPAKTLTVVNAAEQLRIAYDSSGTVYTDLRNDSAGGLLINTSGGYIINYIAGSEKMRTLANGNVLIGTTTDAGYKLDVNGTGRFAGTVTLNSGANLMMTSNDPGNGYISFKQVNNGNRIYRLGTGKVGITYGGFSLYDESAGSTRLFIDDAGAATFISYVTSAGFFESSDKTIKTLITDNYQAKGIESIVAKLYTKNGKEELGYYAQDVQGILPSAVSKGTDGLFSLSYREVHTAKISALEKRVAELEQLLNLN